MANTKLNTNDYRDLSITNNKITAGTIDITTKVTGILPTANGGTGSTSGAILNQNASAQAASMFIDGQLRVLVAVASTGVSAAIYSSNYSANVLPIGIWGTGKAIGIIAQSTDPAGYGLQALNNSATIPAAVSQNQGGGNIHSFSNTTEVSYINNTGNLVYKRNGFNGELAVTTLTANRTYTLPNVTGTLALTSDLSSYVPYTGATANVNIGIYNLTSNRVTASGSTASASAGTFYNTDATGFGLTVRGGTTLANANWALQVWNYDNTVSILSAYSDKLNIGVPIDATGNSITAGAASFTTGAFSSTLVTGNSIQIGSGGTFLGAASFRYSSNALIIYGGTSGLNINKSDNTQVNLSITDAGAATFASSVTATDYRISALNTAPATASSTGTLGEIRYVNGFIYVCVATNTWQRVAIATW